MTKLNIEFLRLNSLTAATLTLKNGEKKLYFSIDKKKDREKGNHKPGMKGLIDRIIKLKHSGEYISATIWDRNNKILAKWDENGKSVDLKKASLKVTPLEELRKNALTHLGLVLLNGEKRFYYSHDSEQDIASNNVGPGVNQLIEKFIEGKHKGGFLAATIWDKENEVLAKWNHLGRVPEEKLHLPFAESTDMQIVKERAFTKLSLILGNGCKKVYYSIDTTSDILKNDLWPGMKGLRDRLVEGKYKGRYKVATIWENRYNGRIIAQWNEHGRRII